MYSYTTKSDSDYPGDGARSSQESLWERLTKQQDPQAREALVLLNLDFAKMLAASAYSKRTHEDMEFADYFQFASLGLLEAVDRFDPQRGVKFATFAAKRISGSIINGLASASEKSRQIAIQTQLRRERLSSIKLQRDVTDQVLDASPSSNSSILDNLADLGISVALGILLEGSGMIDAEAFGNDGCAESPETHYFRKNSRESLQKTLKISLMSIAAKEREVLISHYINDIDFQSIAVRMGLSKGRISQLHKQGLMRLREALNHKILPDIFA